MKKTAYVLLLLVFSLSMFGQTSKKVNVLDSTYKYEACEDNWFHPGVVILPESVWQQFIEDCCNPSTTLGEYKYLKAKFRKYNKPLASDYRRLILACINTKEKSVVNMMVDKFSVGMKPQMADMRLLYVLSKNN